MTQKITLKDIKMSKYNPRKITDKELHKLKKSITQFGLVDPIIINTKTNTIIGGHQRYIALQQTMPDIQLEIIQKGDIGLILPTTNITLKNDVEEKALNLALNKISGDWDKEKLNNILDELQIENIDLEITGFDHLEIEQIQLENDFEYKEIDFNNNDLEDMYHPPTYTQITCPKCGHQDEEGKFKKTKIEGV